MNRGMLEELIARINLVLDAERVLFKINYRVDALQQDRDSIKAFCPIHQDTMIRNLVIDPNRKRFRCQYFNCAGHPGGTLLDLYRLSRNCSDEEAVRFWCEQLGWQGDLKVLEGSDEPD